MIGVVQQNGLHSDMTKRVYITGYPGVVLVGRLPVGGGGEFRTAAAAAGSGLRGGLSCRGVTGQGDIRVVIPIDGIVVDAQVELHVHENVEDDQQEQQGEQNLADLRTWPDHGDTLR